MTKQGVKYFPTQNEVKASTSERVILSLKMKLRRWFSYRDDYIYIPELQAFADSYNGTFHRTIGRAPASVTDSNAEEVRLSTYFSQRQKGIKTNSKLKPFRYKVGDYVRVTHLKSAFTRAYDETYSGELFQIDTRYHRGTLPVYKLKDLNGDPVFGTWYQSELQRVNVNENQLWKVEQVLKTRGKGPNKQYFVKWKYYPKQFNSWVPATDIDM